MEKYWSKGAWNKQNKREKTLIEPKWNKFDVSGIWELIKKSILLFWGNVVFGVIGLGKVEVNLKQIEKARINEEFKLGKGHSSC